MHCKSIAIIQHVADDGPSYFGTYLKQQGVPFRVFRMFAGDALPASVADYAGLCVLGGPMSANDPLPYFDMLLHQIRDAIEREIPVIGHCLGGQLMARALGGTVQASENVEIGWCDLRLDDPAGRRWLAGADQCRLFQWHGESFSIPLDATRILTGDYCANQAFVVGDKHLAMQFHCEVDVEKVQAWLITGHDELTRCVSPAACQASEILPTLQADLLPSQRTADALYCEWLKALAV